MMFARGDRRESGNARGIPKGGGQGRAQPIPRYPDPVPVDHFPSTHATWIDAQLTIAEGTGANARAALDALRRHLMDRYRTALLAYVRGGSLRRLGDAEDLVNGFFADRLCEPRFLLEWRASGMPLRRWMMNGINFHGKGVIRDRARAKARDGGGELADLAGGDAMRALEERVVDERDAERAFDEAWALAVLNDAHARAHAELAAKDRLEDYEVFRRRVIEGERYETIAPSVGRSAQQCAGATRLVTQSLQRALLETLRAEGVSESHLEAEAARVHALLGW